MVSLAKTKQLRMAARTDHQDRPPINIHRKSPKKGGIKYLEEKNRRMAPGSRTRKADLNELQAVPPRVRARHQGMVDEEVDFLLR